MRGVKRKIKALKDFELKTYYEVHFLIKDEVKVVRFKNQSVVDDLLKFHHFIIAKSNEEEVRKIPVLLPKVDENSLVAVENSLVAVEDIPVEDVSMEDESPPSFTELIRDKG